MLLAVTVALQSGGLVVEALRIQLRTAETVDIGIALAAQSTVPVGAA